MGKDLANPIAAIMSAAEMIRFLGEEKAAVIESACRESIAEGQTTGDLGGKLKTTEVTKVVCDIISRS
jgi:tartrate dehydrogenase/decarboxylase/D-malate dehydrogenase